MSNSAIKPRKKKKEKTPGRHSCRIYWNNHSPNKPPFTMDTDARDELKPERLEAKIEKFKGMVAGTRNTKSGNNWAGLITWAAIFRDGDTKLWEFRDWDNDGLPYWKDLR